MIVNRKKAYADMYIIICLLYLLQGVLYPSGGALSQSVMAIKLVVGLFTAYKILLLHNKPLFFKGLNTLLIMFIVYGVILILSGHEFYIREGGIGKVRNIGYLKDILNSLLPIYTFYYFTIKGYFDVKKLKRWIPIFFIIATFQYYRYQAETIELFNGVDDMGITNNAGYVFLSLIPALLLFNKKTYIQYFGLIVANAFIILSTKRGAIFIAALVTITFLWYNLRQSKGKKKFIIITITTLFFILAYQFINDLLINNSYFYGRIQDTLSGNSSHRDEIYLSMWDAYTSSENPIHKLFGRGAYGTLTVGMNFAHNDWLEILTNQGLLGVIIFARFFIYQIKNLRDYSHNDCVKQILILVLIIMFCKTIFSMSYSDISIYLSSVIGYSLAQRKVYR